MLQPSADGVQDMDIVEALDKLWDALAASKELTSCSSCGMVSFPLMLMEYQKDGERRMFVNCIPNMHRVVHGREVEQAGKSEAKDLFDVFRLGSLRASPIAGTDDDPCLT